MIDDNEEEEEEEEGLEEAPPSPSGLLIPSPTPEDTQKLRPTTLNLTVTSTQVRLVPQALHSQAGGGGSWPGGGN